MGSVMGAARKGRGRISMKVQTIIGLLLMSVLVLPAGAMAQTTIYDLRDGANSYWGGTVQPSGHANMDVIGPASSYAWDLTRMEVAQTDSKIQVKIFGPWFNEGNGFLVKNGYAGFFYYNTGDLYISSSGWHTVANSAHYPTDAFAQSEGWDYVVTHRSRPGVYKLDWNSLTYSFSSLGRTDQAFYGGYGDRVGDATVTLFQDTVNPIDESNQSYILYEFDKFLSGDIGLHYTMYCGNDVIEGQATLVPEPGTIFLLVLGLAVLGMYRRRMLVERART